MLKKPSATSTSPGSSSDPAGNPSYVHFPCITSHLAQDAWEDGSDREPGTVLIVFSEGVFRACMIDKNTDSTCWTSCEHLEHLLQCLEETLSAERVRWSKRKGQGSPRASGRR